MENTKILIKSDKQLLLTKLFQYGSIEKKRKQYSCVHCNSSDALSIKENNGTYFYKCFSCGTTGDVINLVEEKESINFMQAVELLAKEKGLIIPKSNSKGTKNENTKPKHDFEKLKKIKKYKINELLKYQEKLLNDNNVDMDEVFSIDKEINEIKKFDYRFSKEEYKRLSDLIKIKRDESNIIPIVNKLTERYEDIKFILNQKGLILLDSPTGSGKTYTIIKAFKELSSKYKDRVFIILCPNRVQNEQNGKEYGVNIIVGGVNAEQHITVMSGVYEKIDEIMEAYRDKDITLIVDEAHELIESVSYRNKQAISRIELAMEKTFNTIHMTATPRKLKEIYEYDNMYKFDFKEIDNNLNNLNIIPAKDIDKTLFTLVKLNKQNNKQSLVFMSGSKNDIKTLGDVLRRKGYKVGVITSEDKQDSLYLHIVEHSKIPDEYDVILSTKVLECGTNIKNKNVVPIEVVKDVNHFNLDSTEQKFARLREKNEEAYLVVREPKEVKSIISFDDIKEELTKFALATTRNIELLKETQKNISIEDYVELMKESIRLQVSAISGISGGILDFNEDELKVAINKKNLINRVFRDYDKQFLYNLDMLAEALKGRVKANNIEVLFDIVETESDEFKEDLREAKKLTKEIKTENTNKAKHIIMYLYENKYLEEYLFAEDKFELLQRFKTYVSESLYNDFKFLEQEEKELLKIQKLFDITVLSEDLEKLIKLYQVFETLAEVDRYAKKISYLEFNEVNPKELPDIYSSYAVIRRKFDKVKDAQGRVTQKDILALVKDLHKKKLLWQFDKQRLKEDYEKYLVEKDKAKKQKILNRIINKTIHELNLIYVLSPLEDGVKISSLK